MVTSANSRRRAAIVKEWRAAKMPRLYWRKNHPNWRTWEKGDIAMWRDGALRVSYQSLAAIEDELIDRYPGKIGDDF